MKGLDPFVVKDLLRTYLKEDLGHGDITSCHLPDKEKTVTAVIRAKDQGILAGLPVVTALQSAVRDTFSYCSRQQLMMRMNPFYWLKAIP